ncbi:MAG: hypothetical protein K2X36_03360, partial [Microbacteriaceae bacterium]|nr:hypothetical protein [Microbacteriaceae bacterium]
MSDSAHSDTETAFTPGSRRSIVLRAIALAVFVAVALTVGVLVPLPPIEDMQSAVAELGWAGAIAFALLYAAITLTPAPKNVLSVAAGLV